MTGEFGFHHTINKAKIERLRYVLPINRQLV